MAAPRTIWISDGAYLFKSAPGRFDYLKLKSELEKAIGAPFAEGYYFNAQSAASPAQDSFNKWLKCAPPIGPQMILKLYSLKNVRVYCPHCGAEHEKEIQKGVDVGIVTMMMKLATQNRYDQIALCAGDGDLTDAVEYIKQMNKRFCLVGFKDSASPDLQCFADQVVWLEDIWDRIRKAPSPRDEAAPSGGNYR